MRRLSALAAVLALLSGCGGSETPAAGEERLGPVQLVEALREGGFVVYLRHAATDRSREDDPAVDLDDCSTQRNLNDAGREQARTIGKAFSTLEIPIGAVWSSEYCRTRETAELAFGDYGVEPDLTGFPEESDPLYEEAVFVTEGLLARVPQQGNTVLVAHIKNIEAAAGVSIEEGELAVFEPDGEGGFEYRGRLPADIWPQLVDELG